ncbi:MAG: ROK family protein [Sphaerochaetaceae bacterium]|nr:ROK family protein [Sphaerochaetaceae bacterium]
MNILMDIGGKGIKATYEYQGTIDFYFNQMPSLATEDRTTIIQNLCQLVYTVWEKANYQSGVQAVNRISMAFPGPFDYARGICRIRGLSKYDSIFGMVIPVAMKQGFERLGYQCAVDAEYRFLHDVEAYAAGVSRTCNLVNNRALYLCIGTGAGSAYSVNGRIVKEGEGVAESGWFYNRPFLDATIDDYISVRGIMSLAETYLGKALDPLELSILAENGDPQAITVYHEFGIKLYRAMRPLIEEFRADTFVLGGNISRSAHLFIDELQQYMNAVHARLIIESNTSHMTFIGLASMDPMT